MKRLHITTQYLGASIIMRSLIKPILPFLIVIVFFNNVLAQRYWVGTGNWTAANTANWSASSGGSGGASVPVAGTNVIFDNNSGSCTIATNNAVCNNITLANNYANTLTQTNTTLTVSGTATFSGGTFTGGTAAITVTGAFTISGGTFTSTSGTLTLKNNFTLSSGTFTHNSGTVTFNNSPSAGNFTTTGAPTFYNLSVIGSYGTFTQTNSITVANTLTLDGSGGWENVDIGTSVAAGITLTVNGTATILGSSSITLYYGTLIENGSLTDNNTVSGVTSGNAIIDFTGTGTFTGPAATGEGELPNIVINTSGTLTLSGNISVSLNWTYIGGTVIPGTSTVYFDNDPSTTISGTQTLYNVIINPAYGTTTISNNLTVNNLTLNGGASSIIAVSSSVTVNGTLTVTGNSLVFINTGTIYVNGNVTDNNTAIGATYGTGTIDFTGTGTQSFSCPAANGEGELPNVTFNSSGTVSLSGIVSVGGNWTYTAGTVSAGTSTVYFDNTSLAKTISGTQTLYNAIVTTGLATTINNNLTISNNLNLLGSNTVTINSVLTVNGTLTISGNAAEILNTGTINANGNVTITNTNLNGGGTATFNISGSGNQTISNTSTVVGKGCLPNVVIASTGGTVTLSGLISVAGNWTYTSGTVDATTNLSTVAMYSTLTTQTLTSAGMSFYNLSLDNLVTNLGSALTVSNNLTIIASGSTNDLNTTAAHSYNITVGGNWTSNATFTANNSTVTFNGTSSQTIYQVNTGGAWPASTYSGPFYNLTITNSSVSNLTNNITITNNLLLSGTATLASGANSITGNSTGTLNLGAGTTLVIGTTGSATVVAFPSAYTTAHITLNSASTVIYQSNAATQAVSTTPSSYGNLYLYTGTTASTKTFAATAITITGNLRVGDTTSAGVIVSALTKTFNITGNLTINSDGNVSYTSGSGILNLTGNFLSNGTYSAANTTNITGNFTNNGTFTQNTSITTFNGSTQTLGGTTSTTFYNLTENGGVGGSLTISEPQVTVSNTLTLTKDNIIVTSGDLLVLPTTITPTGGSASSFVDGNMQAAIGSGATYTFPSGNETTWARIGVIGVSSASTFQAQYFHATPANQSSLAASLDHISTVEYWILTEISGGTANVKLYSENAQVNSGGIYDCPYLAVAHYTGGVWVDADPSVSGSGAGCSTPYTGALTITTGTALASFSPFTFASRIGGWFNNPLPINLVSFSAECINYNALIQWETAGENNNSYFTLERTTDGENYEIIGTIKGAGSSTTSHRYSIFDYNTANGYSYYRLSQTDEDGTKSVLKTIVYTPCENDESINAYNSGGNVIVRINSNINNTYKVILTNTLGQVILTETKNIVPGENIFKFSTTVGNGIYILQLIGGEGKIFTRKIFL
ncbi:MAG TPA: hypothetical protein VK783_07385 [Bacteroidia bacterium]|jgi:hypothetical protein|nr:hypothetical protein [Bacteroidia bacterium]